MSAVYPGRVGRSRDGLFWNPAAGAEIVDNPLSRPCPACNAPAGDRCTRPSRHPGGRASLRNHFHDSRSRHAGPSTPDTRQETT